MVPVPGAARTARGCGPGRRAPRARRRGSRPAATRARRGARRCGAEDEVSDPVGAAPGADPTPRRSPTVGGSRTEARPERERDGGSRRARRGVDGPDGVGGGPRAGGRAGGGDRGVRRRHRRPRPSSAAATRASWSSPDRFAVCAVMLICSTPLRVSSANATRLPTPSCTNTRTPSSCMRSTQLAEANGLHQVIGGELTDGVGVGGVRRARGGRPQRDARRLQGHAVPVVVDDVEVRRERGRVEPRPERELLGEDLPGREAGHGLRDRVLRAADHRLVRAVVVGDHDAVEIDDDLGGDVGSTTEGHEDDAGHLEAARFEAVEEAVGVLGGDELGGEHAGPLAEAVPGDVVGPDAEGHEGLVEEAADGEDLPALDLELGGARRASRAGRARTSRRRR